MPSNNKRAALLQRLKGLFTLNIGTVLFGALLLYMIISLIMYLTSSHFTSYQVVSGPLSRNETYTALAIHDEKVVTADVGGYVNYYAREGSKMNAGGVVYGVSSQPSQTSDVTLSSEDLARIRKQMSNFSYGFKGTNFNSTYSFKSELEGNILQYASSQDTTGQTLATTSEDGIILYSRDGYENVTADTVAAENFDQNAYHTEDLKTRDAVNAGDDIYTIITDEHWSLYIPLSTRQATQLSDRTSVKVKFMKDSLTQNGSFSIVEIDGNSYGKIDLSNGLIRYASDRFLDIELVTNTQSGLKVPLSAIVTKEFYVIPASYRTKGGNGQEAGFLVEQTQDGDSQSVFVSVPVYAEIDDMYYVEKSAFEDGDILIMQDSSDRYVVHDTGNLEGVYCINEGYAKFRRIVILDQNEEYCIVEKGVDYGLAQYDHIVFDAKDVNEEDILI